MKYCYNKSTSSNLNRIISMFKQKKECIYHAVVPINNNSHFLMIDVFLPFPKKTNGEVTIYNYLHKEDNNKKIEY